MLWAEIKINEFNLIPVIANEVKQSIPMKILN